MFGNTKKFIPLFILLGLIAFAMGLYLNQPQESFDANQIQATWLETPRGISPFALEVAGNKTFTNADLQGKWTMMFFGFSRCKGMCPNVLTQITKTFDLLKDKPAITDPQMVMVSVDPKRDTADSMAQYLMGFNPKFIGSRLDDDLLKKMTRELGIAYAEITPRKTGDDDITHSGTILLVNPKGHLRAFFTYPQEANQMAADLEYIVTHVEA